MANFVQSEGVLLFRYVPGFGELDNTGTGLLSIAETYYGVLFNSPADYIASYDGTTQASVMPASWEAGDEFLIAVLWSSSESSISISVSENGGLTWGVWADVAYDGAFDAGTDLNLFYDNAYKNNLKWLRLYDTLDGGTIAAAKTWVEANAGNETEPLSEITGTGALQAGDATFTGSGLREITGDGNLSSNISGASGSGLREIAGTGALQAGDAIFTGSGLREIAGTGALVSDVSLMSGIGANAPPATGTGALQAGDAIFTGSGLREIAGTGALVSDVSLMSGVYAEFISGNENKFKELRGSTFTAKGRM